MAQVKFVRSVKYEGNRYSAHTPFEVNDKDLALLESQGAIILTCQTSEPAPEVETPVVVEIGISAESVEISDDTDESEKEDVEKLKKELMDYSVAELTEFAKERSINLLGRTKKADIYNMIVSAL